MIPLSNREEKKMAWRYNSTLAVCQILSGLVQSKRSCRAGRTDTHTHAQRGQGRSHRGVALRATPQ